MRTWLITGSSRGLGRELAEAALAAGDNVLATARRPEQLDDLVRKYGDKVAAFALDVTDAEAAKAAVRFAQEKFGGLDVVANNAGYAASAPIEFMAEKDFRDQFEANFFGVVNVTKAALPLLRKQRSGHILQFSSVGGRVGGSPGLSAYQSAKFAVEGFSEVLNNEVKPFGVKVTIIEPGPFRTDWAAFASDAAIDPDYDGTVGEMDRYRAETAATWPGDPVRAGQVIVDMVHGEEAPLRLLLGARAVDLVRQSEAKRGAEMEKWAEISRSADFPTD
ncbi:oxidoreductase [Kutzneria sp. CA-103260]|uniref:oxidoreductase n=1 Tax=Kutzneria sp. CA-103260 TaxID=2802641 RepID=UPI001BEEB6BE|nr:oxidoreductase [Kutzneria sp. CA-103260]QUQ68364.1 short-chain dehydrogenase/reductase SDR [Kutzneria sp. CA-103260]